MYRHFEVVGKDCHGFEQLLDEYPSLLVGRGFPHSIQVQVLKRGEHVLEATRQVVLGGGVLVALGMFGPGRFDLCGEAG